MLHTDVITSISFSKEIEKIAYAPLARFYQSKPWLQEGLRSSGSLGGLGALAGAGVGALRGAYQGYNSAAENEDPHQSTLSRVLGRGFGGLSGAMGGVMSGGLVGGALGAGAGLVGGSLASKISPNLSNKIQKGITDISNKEDILGGASRFGQRQIHGLTGWKPEDNHGGLQGLRLESSDTQGHIRGLANQEKHIKEQLNKTSDPKVIEELNKKLEGIPDASRRMQERLEHQLRMEDQGVTTLPGIVMHAAKEGPMRAVKDLFNYQYKGQKASDIARNILTGGPGLAGLAGGAVPGAALVGELAGGVNMARDLYGAYGQTKEENPNAGLGEVAGNMAVRVGGNLLGQALPMSVGHVVNEATGKILRGTGKAFDTGVNAVADIAGIRKGKDIVPDDAGYKSKGMAITPNS